MKYTAGELAKQLGVSARTVRFYDEKNLLAPCGYSDAGYRLYNENSAERLQKIIMLKFMDFSLEQICEIMKEEHFDVRKSLEEQELLLLEKKEHIERVIDALRKAKNTSDDEFWDKMHDIIDMTKGKEEVNKQYLKDENLNKRISIHDYSTAEVDFYAWMFDKIELAPYMKVLDIGCGNATFWKSIAEHLPEGIEVHLVDYSDGMLESARKTIQDIYEKYPQKKLRFVLDKRDATDFSYPIGEFDRIMANHMLYHLSKESRRQLYLKIKDLLKEQGRFSCSLIGKNHLLEMHGLVEEYYPMIENPSASFDLWLENAKDEIQEYFDVIFVEEHENDLLVPDEAVIFDYVSSYSKQAKKLLSCNKELFLERVRSKMNEDGYMYIHKSTGIVVCG